MSKSTCNAALALALTLALAACDTPTPPPAQGATPVTTVTLQTGQVALHRELPGRTAPFLVSEIRPQVNGIVKARQFAEGGLVEAGQPLYQIDDAAYRAAVSGARAQVARAEATLTSVRLTAARFAELVKTHAVSVQDNENAIAALKQAEADLDAARAALESANVTLGYARITSPINGRIGKSSVTQGALVSAGQPEALATVQQLDPIYVDLTQSSAELLQLRRQLANGDIQDAELPVTILLEDGSEFSQKGTLAFSEVSVDPATGSFAIRVVVDNPDHVLLPGMYVRAMIASGVRENAILVPMQGISRDPKGDTSALVVNEAGVVEQRPVVVSHAIGDKWLVEDGLAAGDRVIVAGLQKVQPGMTVQISTPPPAAQASTANAEATAPTADGAAS